MSRAAISIDVLQVLDAIERRGSFARAAEELGKATSALSYTVQKLEEQLGITVFQRQGRRSVLTPAGRLLLEEGREILAATQRLANRAVEVATGWEARIAIALESTYDYGAFFRVLGRFAGQHPAIEIDVVESVLNGGWEMLECDRVDLLVGAPGPVPRHKGYRAVALGDIELVPVISRRHPVSAAVGDPRAIAGVLPSLRRVVTHDTSVTGVARSAGLSHDGSALFVQNREQKLEAIVAGIGVGHLPRQRVQGLIDSGELLELKLDSAANHQPYLAWKISHKGRGLKLLSEMLAAHP